jgi:hypothetical protein
MSNMLKESIVDAKALRDSALKNAESVVIQKYSKEVKNTLEKLLEQEESFLDLGAEEAALDTNTEVEEVVEDQNDVPYAATDNMGRHDGDNLSDLPSAGENIPVTIDLGALQEALEEIGKELDDGVEMEIDAETLVASIDEASKPDFLDLDKDGDKEEPMKDAASDDDDDDDEEKNENIDQEAGTVDSLVDAIMEKLTADMGAELSGWAGRPTSQLKQEQEKELAAEAADDSSDEEDEEDNLQESDTVRDELVAENNELKQQLEKYQSVLAEVKENLFEVNFSNARLLYTNRVLRNTSLNERQKEKIVEAISNAGSVSEAKTIFETLQSTVQAKPRATSPQSLSEAIGRRSSVLTASRKETKTSQDPFSDRMRRLAGIK